MAGRQEPGAIRSAASVDSVLWLAAALRQRSRDLGAGMIVMTGSIVRTRFPEPGRRWTYAVDGPGGVEVTT